MTQIVMNLGVLPCLLSLITHFSYDSVCKEACWAIANIAAGAQYQIAALMSANIIPPLIVCMSRGNFDVQQEAAWAISNICTGGTEENIRYLVGQGCIRPLCDLLGSVSATTVSVALDSLEHILMVGQLDNSSRDNVFAGYIEIAGGKEKVEALVDGSHNAENAAKALDLLIRFYDKRDDMAMAEHGHLYRAHAQHQEAAQQRSMEEEPNYFASAQQAAMPQHDPFSF